MKLSLIRAVHPSDLEFWANLGFGYLASYARAQIPDLEVVVAADAEEIERQAPDIVGISAVSQNYGEAVRLARVVRARRPLPILIGGPHISALPATLDESMTAAIVGEGEQTLTELLQAFRAAGNLSVEAMSAIPGLAFRAREGAPVTRTADRPLIEPLDRIPHPDREVLHYHGEDTYLFTSRGCPFKCTFCSSTAYWQRFRAFSAAYVIEELQQLHERYGTRRAHFFDDLFVADGKRLAEICRLAQEQAWAGKMEFSCAVRAELVTPEMIERLKALNVTRVTFGAESHDEATLSYLKGGAASPEHNQRAVDLLADAGIAVGLSFVKGAPVETRPALCKTYDFIRRNVRDGKLDQADINVLTPFPGTPIWELAAARGVVSPAMDWSLLRRPWPRLVLNPLLLDEADWVLCQEQEIRRMLLFVQTWQVHALLVADGAVAPESVGRTVEQMARVRQVTHWFVPCAADRAAEWTGRPLSRRVIQPGAEAEALWWSPQRERLHIRIVPEALDRPELLSEFIWSLYEFSSPALCWREGDKIMAEGFSPEGLLMPSEALLWREFVPGEWEQAVARRLAERPSLQAVLAACDNTVFQMYDRMLRAEAGLRRGARDHEVSALARRVEELEQENAARGVALQNVQAELRERIQRILDLQAEVEEKNRWAASLDREVNAQAERILLLQRMVGERDVALAEIRTRWNPLSAFGRGTRMASNAGKKES